jgi:hypothetical protein
MKDYVLRQREFKARMYAAGYRQRQTWVFQDDHSDEIQRKMDKRFFILKLDDLMVSLSDTKKARIFSQIIHEVETRIKCYGQDEIVLR